MDNQQNSLVKSGRSFRSILMEEGVKINSIVDKVKAGRTLRNNEESKVIENPSRTLSKLIFSKILKPNTMKASLNPPSSNHSRNPSMNVASKDDFSEMPPEDMLEHNDNSGDNDEFNASEISWNDNKNINDISEEEMKQNLKQLSK